VLKAYLLGSLNAASIHGLTAGVSAFLRQMEMVMPRQDVNTAEVFEPSVRALEKQAARDRDGASLASGERSREQVQRDNGFIRAGWGLRIDYRNAPVAG
jgi:hypothetical protein